MSLMTDTPTPWKVQECAAEVGSNAIVQLAESLVAPKARPDSPGWWWCWWYNAWRIAEVVSIHPDNSELRMSEPLGASGNVAHLNNGWRDGSLWVKADLPSFAPSAVEVAQALDANTERSGPAAQD